MEANRDRWHEIDALFVAALDREPAEREAFLERACETDESLRQAVAALLEASTEAESFLETPIFTFADGLAVARSGDATSAVRVDPTGAESSIDPAGAEAVAPMRDLLGLAGRQVSGFRVERVLSCGGMGVVYRGRDLRLGRAVALKFLLPQYSLDSAAEARFLHEARAASLLDHPNICTIHETGETEEGHLYLAMPCYAGESLDRRLARSGPLPIGEAIGLARQMARGLGATHAAGIVHRDLKPSNLMRTPEGTLKVLDFGLAKVRDLSLTVTGQRAGTVAYMSPEQLEGEAVDGRSDLWSLGVVLYELLSGKLPFGAGHELATVYRILHEEPTPLSSVQPDASGGLAHAVGRLLRKDPADRYASATEVLHALDSLATSPLGADAALLAGPARPKAERPTDQPEDPRRVRHVSRPRRAALVGGLALLAGAGVTLALMLGNAPAGDGTTPAAGESSLVSRAGAADRTSLAVLPFVNVSQDPESEYFSDGITDEILTMLANVGDLRVIGRTSTMQYKDSSMPLRQIAAELDVVHIVEGSVERAGERVRITARLIDASTGADLWAERHDRPSQEIFAVQSEIAQQIAEALEADLTEVERARIDRRPTVNLTAHDYVLRAREFLWRPQPRNAETALALLRKARELDPSYADALAALSDVFRWQYWFGGDRLWLDSAKIAAQRTIALDPEFAQGYAELGWTLDFSGERERSLEAHRLAVERSENLSAGLANLYHYGFGRLDEAARWWRPALERDPTHSLFYWLAARTYLELGMFDRVRPLVERALEFQPDARPPHYFLITLLLLEGRYEELGTQIEEMLDATNNAPEALLYAGHIAAAIEDFPAARRYFEQGLAGAPDFSKAQGTLGLAWVLRQLGEADRARSVVRDAAQRFEKRWGGSPRRTEDFVDLAKIRLVEGDPQAALRLMEEAVRRGWRLRREPRIRPILDSLRGEPSFDQLMAEVKADVDRQRARVEREGW